MTQHGRPQDRARRLDRWVRLGGLFVLVWCAALGGSLRAGDPPSNSGLDRLSLRVQSVLETPLYREGHWGILVVNAKTGRAVYERNADQLFAPASVTKLFSTSAALVDLGPNHRFQTPLVRRGEVNVKGTLHGDMILVAQGDLCLGGRTGPDGSLLFKDEDHTYSGGNLRSEIVATDPLAGLEHLARDAEAAGIKEITGDVIVDDRLFAPAFATGSGPRRVGPILINDNVIDILADPASTAGMPAQRHVDTGDDVRDDGFGGPDGRRGPGHGAGGPRGRPSSLLGARSGAGRPCPRGQDLRDRGPVIVCPIPVDRGDATAGYPGRVIAARRELDRGAASSRRCPQIHQGRRVYLAPVPGIYPGHPEGQS